MENFKLNGLVAAPVTPFDSNGDLNLAVTSDYIDLLLKQGVKQVYVCGYTGEGPSMAVEDRKKVAEAWVRESKGRLETIIIQVGGGNLKDAQTLAKHAEQIGAHAIASLPPMFYPCTVTAVVDYLRQLGSVVPTIPLMYYHIPGASHVKVTMHEVLAAAASQVPSLVGCKFTHNDFIDLQRCLTVANGKYQISLGCDEGLLIGLQLGVKSAIGSTYNFLGKLNNDIIVAFEEGDMEKAWRLQYQAQDIISAFLKYGCGPVVQKEIMSLIGLNVGPPILPLQSLSRSDSLRLQDDLKKLDFFKCVGI